MKKMAEKDSSGLLNTDLEQYGFADAAYENFNR